MKRITKYTFAALTLIVLLAATACGATDNEATAPNTAADVTYEQLSAEQAKEIMDSEQPYYLIDARTDAEFAEGHIAGAVVIPEYEIAQRAENEIADKDALILVYCRSGRRSKIAAEELIKLGYTNVKEFGGIIDWPYEIEK